MILLEGFFVVHANENEKYDIICEIHPEKGIELVPEIQQKLYIEVESTNNIIKSLNDTNDIIKMKYFNKLLSLAQAGLVGDTAQPQLSFKSLEKLKEEIILIEGQRIKNQYMKKLGINAIIMCGIIFTIWILVDYWFEIKEHHMYCTTYLGAMLGTWISFGARKFSIKFTQLSNLEEDMMEPCIRLIYIGICSLIVILFINSGIIAIKIGSMSLKNIKTNFELQAIIGISCGLIESKIGVNIYKKAINIIGD